MNIQTISLSKVASTSVRASGFSSTQFKAATWRADDLLVQMKNGEVLVLKGANAKRLSTPEFFLVFDDTSLPLASFAPGMDQPVAKKAPHVPPFEVAAPVKVGKLPQGGNKAKGAASADDNPADEAWADQALAITNAGANTAAPEASVSTSSVPLADNASTAPAASTTHTSAEASASAATSASVGSSLWGWPAVALGMGGAVALSHGGGSAAAASIPSSAGTVSGLLVLGPVTNGKDLLVKVFDTKGNLLGADVLSNDGSFNVSLDKAPATSVIRVVVVPVSNNTGSNDYIGEDGNKYDLLNPVSALTTFEAGKASTVNVTHYTDILARNLVEAKKTSTGEIALSATELKAASTAFAKALGVTTTDTPIEQLRPQPTVDAQGNTTTNPDLYGQLLKTVFEQVQAAQVTATTTNEKTNAVDETLNALAQAITINLPTSTSTDTTASVSISTDLGKVVLAAKVADYVANSNTSAAVSSAPTLDDYKAAGFTDVSNAEQANAALANAVKSATSGNSGTTATPLLDVVQQQLATNKAPTAVTLTTAFSEIAEIPNNGSRTARTKVADIAVADDGLGTNTLTLAGADAASFELQGNALYLKAGVTLDFEAKKTYAVTVQAADAALTGSSPVSADFTLKVTNVNEAPTATGRVSPVTAFKDTPITEIDLSTQFSDVDVGDTRTYSLSTGSELPAGLSLDTRTGKISGTPTATTSGTSSITVVATDTGGLTAEQTFSLTVNAINHAPTGTDGSVAAKEDSPYVLKAADFGFKDATGETGELLNVILTALPAQGSLKLNGTDVSLTDGKAVVSKADIDAGKLTFQAAANQHADSYATLSFKVQDNGGTVGTGAADTSASANTLTFNVASVNDAPTGTDGSVAAKEDSPYVLKAADFGFKDATGETGELLNVILTALPEKGSLLLDGKAVTLTDGKAAVSKANIDAGLLTFQAAPNANGDGYARLSFKVQDSGGTDNGGADTSASANTLTFNVAAVNDAPTAKGTVSAVAVTAGTAITDIDLSSKFEDVDTSDTLTYTVTGGTLPSGLSLTDGKITGTPDTPTSGTSHITVTATDSSDAKATQTFDLTVLRPVSVDKVAGDDVISLAEKNASVAMTGMAVVDSTVTITLPDGSTQRTTTADGTGAWTYTLTNDDYTALGQGTGKTVSVSSYDPVTKVTSPTVTHQFDIDTVVPEFRLDTQTVADFSASTHVNTPLRIRDIDPTKSSFSFNPYLSSSVESFSYTSFTRTADELLVKFNYFGNWVVFKLIDSDTAGIDFSIVDTNAGFYLNSFNVYKNFKLVPNATFEPLQLQTDTGVSANDGITNSGLINVSGLESGATWKYQVNGADYQAGTGTSFTVTDEGSIAVKVQQFDAAGNPSEVKSLTFTLDTTPPTFTDGDIKTVSVAENTAIATAVLTASATDKGAAVTQYAFAGGDDDDKFVLDAATGKLTFKASPDFEAPSSKAGSNAYTVKIKAVDTAGNSAVQTITVNVTDVNDGPKPVPVLTQVSDDVGPVQGDVSALQVARIATASLDRTTLDNRVTISPTVSGSMTVEGWFKTDDPTSGTSQQLFYLDGMELQVVNGTLRTWALSGDNQTVSSVTVDNQWHHYALTTDGAGQWQVWVDGELKQERTGGTIGATPAAQTIYVGGHAGAENAGLRGAVSQVQVWDSQRSATDIAADMHDTYTGGKNSAGETPANLVGVWALAGNGDNQVSGGVSATLGTATSSEAASIQFLFNYQTDDATPTLSGTLNVALGSGERLVLLDGDTEVPATATLAADGLSWHLVPTSPLGLGAHNLVVKVKLADGGYSTSPTLAQETYHVTATEPLTHAATFGGDTSGSVTEDAATNIVNGTLTVSDADAGEAGFQTPTSLSGTYGSFTFDSSNGKWTYTLDSSKAATQALTSSDSKTETLTVKSTDGTTQDITVTLHGADEASAPVIPPPPVIDTTVPAWISASPYVVALTKEAFKALTPQQQGMASLISDDVIAAGGELTPANQSSWLGMNDDGTRKTGQSGDGPLTLTYAFENSGAYYTTGTGEKQTQKSFEEPEKSFISSVFKRFADVANVQFTEITDSATSQTYKVDGGADLRMFKGTKDEYHVGDTTMGFAYLPTSEDAQHPTDKLADSEGDFFLVTDLDAYPQTNPFSSAYGVEKSTVTHELGHAMGLNHPFANDAYTSHWYGDTTGTAANRLGDVTGGSYDAVTTDAPQETIMTYLSPFGDLTPTLYDTSGYAPIATERYAPIDLGVYDIAALQHLYGANMSHATGNDVYKYSSDTPVFATIWDAGGNDTLQQEGSQDAVIDLRGGDHMSRMGLFTSYSATFSKSALESALGGTISDWYGVYTVDGHEHRVGHVTHAGDDYTYYADPSMPANTTVAIKVDYSKAGDSTTLSEGIADLDNVGVPDASMAYNIGIAFGVVIEDAIGGSGNDVIWGNVAANTIETGDGNDVLEYDTAANINGDTITDFSASDTLNIAALHLDEASVAWDSSAHKLSHVDSLPANSWALTIQGTFDKHTQVIYA